jgi:hypothetical protein
MAGHRVNKGIPTPLSECFKGLPDRVARLAAPWEWSHQELGPLGSERRSGAADKDLAEQHVHWELCAGTVSLAGAQAIFITDWRKG